MTFQPWDYRAETRLTGDELDPTGYSIAAVDGDIGHVDEASNETSASWLVVDTGAWIFGRKILLPAGVVERIDTVEKKLYVDRTRYQIKNAPEYDPSSDILEYRDRLGSYYSGTYDEPDIRM